ncbi:MAG TPA: DUF1080 domain-containing protein [Planctomycetaceae bacterium]|nr:DUF1080 domain-containing protein [Planctomycetaceae bacterium]
MTGRDGGIGRGGWIVQVTGGTSIEKATETVCAPERQRERWCGVQADGSAQSPNCRARRAGRPLAVVCWFFLLPGLASWSFAGDAAEQPPAAGPLSPKRTSLINPRTFPTDWFFFSADPKAERDDTWALKTDQDEPVLVCLGKDKPFGYLRTVRSFRNYRLGLEWMYPDDANGNSGILVNTEAVGANQAEGDKIWPKAIQVQLHRPKAGSVFPSGGAKTENTLEVKDLSAPLKQWNSCVITVRDGTLSVTVNNKNVGQVTGCSPSEGSIALQCEGSEIHFRRIWIESLTSETPPPKK